MTTSFQPKIYLHNLASVVKGKQANHIWNLTNIFKVRPQNAFHLLRRELYFGIRAGNEDTHTERKIFMKELYFYFSQVH